MQRLAATTLNSIRSASRINSSDKGDMVGIKMNLDSQLSEAEGEGGSVRPPYKSDTSLLSTTWSVTAPRTAQPNVVTINELSRDQFYVLEPELCDILKVGVARCVGGRGQCLSPVAQLLDNVYFIPIEK